MITFAAWCFLTQESMFAGDSNASLIRARPLYGYKRSLWYLITMRDTIPIANPRHPNCWLHVHIPIRNQVLRHLYKNLVETKIHGSDSRNKMCFIFYDFICSAPGCTEISVQDRGISWNPHCRTHPHNDNRMVPSERIFRSIMYGACCDEHAAVAPEVRLPRPFYRCDNPAHELPRGLPSGPDAVPAPIDDIIVGASTRRSSHVNRTVSTDGIPQQSRVAPIGTGASQGQQVVEQIAAESSRATKRTRAARATDSPSGDEYKVRSPTPDLVDDSEQEDVLMEDGESKGHQLKKSRRD